MGEGDTGLRKGLRVLVKTAFTESIFLLLDFFPILCL